MSDSTSGTTKAPLHAPPSSELDEPRQSGGQTGSTAVTNPETHPQPNAEQNKKKKIKKLPLTRLPSVGQILKAIPKGGISLKELTTKFSKQLDESNVEVLAKILDSFDDTGSYWVKQPAKPPTQNIVDRIVENARKPPTDETSKAFLADPITITYGRRDELVRRRILPEKLYRVCFEDSATLCAYTSTHTHPRNRESLESKLKSKNAFQSIGTFEPKKDINRDRFERHLKWNKKKNPSSYISLFNNLDDAKRRCAFLYQDSQRVAHRVLMVVLKTDDLVPISFRGTLKGMFTSGEREVSVPAWVSKEALVSHGDATTKTITLQGLKDSGAEVYFSITGLRMCDMKVPAADGHDYEWLAGGFIPKTRVEDVWPFDGKELHMFPKGKEIRSLDSMNIWQWDDSNWTWKLLDAKKRKYNDEQLEKVEEAFRKRLARCCSKCQQGDEQKEVSGKGVEEDTADDKMDDGDEEAENDEEKSDEEEESDEEDEDEPNSDNRETGSTGNALIDKELREIESMNLGQLAKYLAMGYLAAREDGEN
ncbi:hypothetical protein DM02DRAFT_690757 [Periconia macrospinosa]|uniref:Uncharacterized protein n=1 Tax=Periconia macrospinosa TaxID=97972 RepID=A0A2V1ED33_9PLEO|nr:hypothetical protein DM02DRAFT_690757 [Periconia macrospinosa]